MPDLKKMTKYVETYTKKLFLNDFITHVNEIMDCYLYICDKEEDNDIFDFNAVILEIYTRFSFIIEHDLAIITPMLPNTFITNGGRKYSMADAKENLVQARKDTYAFFDNPYQHPLKQSLNKFIFWSRVLLREAIREYNKGNYNKYDLIMIKRSTVEVYKAVRAGLKDHKEGILLYPGIY